MLNKKKNIQEFMMKKKKCQEPGKEVLAAQPFVAIRFEEDRTVAVLNIHKKTKEGSIRLFQGLPDAVEAKHQGSWYRGTIIARGGK